MTAALISKHPTAYIVQPRMGITLAYHPVVCGRCGNRPGHPLARVCTDTNCALRANDDAPVSHGAGITSRLERSL